jgi:hypothetical protein
MSVEGEGTTPGTATAPTGQVTATPAPGPTSDVTPPASQGKQGQTATTGKPAQTTGTDSTKVDEPTFFDPKSVKPELVPAYKDMQRAFQKKMEAISKDRQKIDAFNAFERDPVGSLQSMAQRMGFSLSRADAQAMAQQGQQHQDQNWEPKTWQEVVEKIGNAATQQARENVLRELSPYLGQIQEMRKVNVEKILDDAAPDWRQYEDDMKGNLSKHPSLVNDPVMLYRMSVPPEVLEGRAAQSVLKRMEDKVKGSQTAGTSTTTKTQVPDFGDKALSFNEAVKAAKASLASRGIHPPRNE